MEFNFETVEEVGMFELAKETEDRTGKRTCGRGMAK